MSTTKLFMTRLHKLLDEIDMPKNIQEREVLFAEMFDIPKQKSKLLLNGSMLPSDDLLEEIARELEVDSEWLIGKQK